jgi:hypothetical protein
MRDFVVKILVQFGLYKPIVSIINRVKESYQARRVRHLGVETLHEANAACEEASIIMFPAFGTLLGAIRDKGFISYDFDLDVGVTPDVTPDTIHESMRRHGFVLTKQTYIPEVGVTEETYYRKKVGVDVFYYFAEGDDWYAYCPRKHEYKDWKEANASDGFPVARSYVPKSEFEKTDFLGIQINVPEKAHQWLKDIYSDSYMIPIKNWNAKDYKTRIIPTKERCYRKYI